MAVLNVRDNETSYSVQLTIGDGGEIITIDIGHVAIHNGGAWVGGCIDEAVGPGGYTAIGLSIEAGCPELMHAYFRVSAGGDARVWLYEMCTFSGGAVAGMVNRNRMLGTALDGVTLHCNPTIISSGTCLKMTYIPGGTYSLLSPGGIASEANGWVLRQPGTTYCLVARNDTDGPEPIALGVSIMDETPE